MSRFMTAVLVAGIVLGLGALPADADGGNGASYCSISSKPDGFIVLGDISTYDNAGEFVTSLAPLQGDPGYGWNVQSVCNPNRFEP